MTEEPEQSDETSGASIDATGEFFSVGAPLHAVRPGYIRRAADEILYTSLTTGHNAHVLASDRTGKSSLISATSARLRYNGIKVAVIDLAQIGERDGGTNPGRWYYSIAYRMLRQLRLKVDLQNWWQDKSMLSNRQRLVEFYIEIVLMHVKEQVVIFIDELQCVANLPFAGDLLASVRAAHNARTTDQELSRLSFALVCECDPGSLISDERLSPFSVSREIRLTDFTRDDLDLFATELNLSVDDATSALDRIFYWTNGQPYLSQKLARSVSRENVAGDIPGHVDRIATQQLAGRAALHSEPHMSHVHRQIVGDKKNYEAMLNLYGKIRKGITVEVEGDSPVHRRLLATGLVVTGESGEFEFRNRLYQRVFTSRWANDNLPLHWRGPAIAAAIMLALTAIPFAYTQLLPRPYMNIIFSPTLELQAVQEAYVNLRSFPGHADAADRVFESVLVQRADAARDAATIAEIEHYALTMPDSNVFAARLVANFWDRQVIQAERGERRDAALIASLESLRQSTTVRRRTAASLIGQDYQQLVAGIPGGASDRLVFNPEHMLVSLLSGAQVSQWGLAFGAMQAREPWTLSALEVTPLVRRVVVDRSGSVGRIGLTVNIGHGRLDDLRLKLIAPSGRTTELAFDRAASSETDDIRFSQDDLNVLVGESLNGTWSLSLRDEATGVTGHLIGWNLRLDSQVIVENFERGLDISDPVARDSNDIWLADDGRYAVARAQQSDSARLWDLAYAQPARTIAIPAGEDVLGLSANGEFLLTSTPDSVNRWRTADGRRSGALEIGAVSADAIFSSDGQHLFVLRQRGLDVTVELWSIESREMIAEFGVAGDIALVAIDGDGSHLAIADYDRAVRIWNFQNQELIAQIDLAAQPTAMSLSANGMSLVVVHGEQGVSLWRTDRPERPVLFESHADSWAAEFSPSGARVVVGNSRHGYQVHRSSDGAVSGPLLDSGLQRGPDVLLGFSEDENYVLTARASEHARVWHVPPTEVVENGQRAKSDELSWRQPGDSTIAISPGARRLAMGDSAGHVHFLEVDASSQGPADEEHQISYLGHRGAVVAIVFSDDGSLVASAGFDGTVRIWETDSGLPRPFFAGASTSTVGKMRFSPSSDRLAILSGLRAWIMDAETGALITDVQLGENHSALAFADNDTLYLGSDAGVLRSLTINRAGGLSMRNVWTSAAALQNIEVSRNNHYLVIVDATDTARILDLRDGTVGEAGLQLPGPVHDIVFSPGDSRVLFKTARWIHRASVSLAGLVWLDAVRAPKALSGSRMVFEDQPDIDRPLPDTADPFGDRVIVLTRDAGFAEVAELNFGHTAGPTLIGNKTELLSEWRDKLLMAAEPAAADPAN